jgi:hypothetical protein
MNHCTERFLNREFRDDRLFLMLLILALGRSAAQAQDPPVKITIRRVTPLHSPTAGGDEITVFLLESQSSGPFYCRFDSIVVPGTLISIDKVRCVTPPHEQGRFPLSVSRNQVDWSAGFTFAYRDYERSVPTVLIVVVVSAILSFGIFLIQMRQCKNNQLKHHRNPAALADGYYPSQESPATSKRKSPRL